MSRKLRGAAALAVMALMVPTGAALAETAKIGPVKGATYSGEVDGRAITLKVSKSGAVKVSLPVVPFYCQGGTGPEVQSSKSVPDPKTHSIDVKISYTAAGSKKPFATAIVKGYFDTFVSQTSVFDGTVRTIFAGDGSKVCNGQSSFQAKLTAGTGDPLL